MKNFTLSFALSFVICFANAQNNTAVNSRIANPSAALDLSINTNNKAFLPPRVTITTLDNIISPISNPAEGLVVYNVGNDQLTGFYIFLNGVWSLLATRENSIMNAVYQNPSNTVFPMSSTFNTLGGFVIVSNNSGGDITITGGSDFTLQPGKYVFTIALNVQNLITDETNVGAAITNGTISSHAHFYTGRMWDGSESVGQNIKMNATSNTSGSLADGRKHSVVFNFSFEISTVKTVKFQLARPTGGSYNGDINIINTSIIIEKSY